MPGSEKEKFFREIGASKRDEIDILAEFFRNVSCSLSFAFLR